jgi:uncharacterized membrane protein
MTQGPEETPETGETPGAAAGARRRAAWARLLGRAGSGPAGPGGSSRADLNAARVPLIARAGHLEYDRILFFSDAIFAIAITLLIVDLPAQLKPRGPVSSASLLREVRPSIYSFAISFIVIGVFWMSHHGLFRFVAGFDRRLILANLLFLGSIAFMPVPTALQSSPGSGQAPAVVFYAACVGLSGLLLALTWAYACLSKRGLISGIDTRARWFYFLSIVRVPVVFGASIGIAQVSVEGAQLSWLAIWALDIVINFFFRQRGGTAVPDPELPAG